MLFLFSIIGEAACPLHGDTETVSISRPSLLLALQYFCIITKTFLSPFHRSKSFFLDKGNFRSFFLSRYKYRKDCTDVNQIHITHGNIKIQNLG